MQLSLDLQKLNSLTKYPSIPTYHELGERGALTEIALAHAGPLLLTEKVDGTNARIIVLPEGYILGSREELLYAQGDLIGNPALGIVECLRPIVDGMNFDDRYLTVYYGEVYGGKIGNAAKHYSATGAVDFRLFDVAVIADYLDVLALPQREIAAWRDAGGQRFCDEDTLRAEAERHGLKLTPRIGTLDALPAGTEDTHRLLGEQLPASLSTIDRDPAGSRPEGIVARSADRAFIAKLRFEDYERTAGRKKLRG